MIVLPDPNTDTKVCQWNKYGQYSKDHHYVLKK